MISHTKKRESFPTAQFTSNGFSGPDRLDRTSNDEGNLCLFGKRYTTTTK